MNGLCRECGRLPFQAEMVEGRCIICREQGDFGTPVELSDKLRMLAAAQRAQHTPADGSIRCLATGCSNTARTWWYVCSRECRDRLVKEELAR